MPCRRTLTALGLLTIVTVLPLMGSIAAGAGPSLAEAAALPESGIAGNVIILIAYVGESPILDRPVDGKRKE